jgi:hypothetical protein
MRTAVMECCDLDVLDIATAVRPLVLETEIRKVNVAVEERQIVLVRPLLDLSRIAVRTPVGVGLIAFAIV